MNEHQQSQGSPLVCIQQLTAKMGAQEETEVALISACGQGEMMNWEISAFCEVISNVMFQEMLPHDMPGSCYGHVT